MAKLSICVVNYNNKDLTAKCINSLYQTIKSIEFEIIVVDNASNDGSVEFLKREFPHLKIISNPQNLGFSKANNKAFKESKGEYILFLNNDTYCLNDVIEKMINFIEQDEKIAVVGIRLLNVDGTIQRSSYIFPSVKTVFLHLINVKKIINYIKIILKKFPLLTYVLDKELKSYIFYDNHLISPCETDIVPGACILIRRKAFEEVGGFDENFFLYFEDLDIFKRIKERNWKIFLLPFTGIVHYGGASFKMSFSDFSSERYNGVLYYFSKHHDLMDNISVRLIFMAVIPFKLIYLIIFGKKSYKEKIKSVKDFTVFLRNIFKMPLKIKNNANIR